MADIAKEYYDGLQGKNMESVETPISREQAITDALACLKGKISDENKNLLGEPTNTEEVTNALMSMKNGSAAGTNGIPYELWKSLAIQYKQDSRKEENLLSMWLPF